MSCFRSLYFTLDILFSKDGIHTNPKKIEKVKNVPIPQSLRQVRSFIGLASYYRKFIQDFATIAKPLHDLMRKHVRFKWTAECTKAFERLKTCLITAPILALPRAEGQYVLDTDASAYGIGAVLQQIQDGQEKVIAYASKALSHAEQQYCTTRRELLAIVVFLEHFRHYLYGQPITVRTDHGSLKWLMNFKTPTGQLARWNEQIAEYNLEIVYRPGRHHGNADTMSRLPSCTQCGQDDTCERPVRICTTVIQPAWTRQELSEAQQDDPALHLLFTCKLNKEDRPSLDTISRLSRAAKYYFGLWEQIELSGNVLCKRWESDDGKTRKFLVLVPEKYVDTVLHELHSTDTAGHQGVNKTLAKIKQRFIWYGMTADVRSWVRQCDVCTQRKQPRPNPRAELTQFKPG